MDTHKKVAVISGASSGIGKAVSLLLLKKSYTVYGISRSLPDIDAENFIWIQGDLTQKETYDSVSSRIKGNRIEVLINNAGVSFEYDALTFNDEKFNAVFDINFKAPILLTKALKPLLTNGTVITISSVSDRLVGEQYALYCSSKAALNKYFEVTALEEKAIKFISILPSYVDTPLLRNLHDTDDFDWESTMQPDHVAIAIEHIISSGDSLSSGAKVIVVSDALRSDLEYNEDLWGYIVDTKKLFPLQQKQTV